MPIVTIPKVIYNIYLYLILRLMEYYKAYYYSMQIFP